MRPSQQSGRAFLCYLSLSSRAGLLNPFGGGPERNMDRRAFDETFYEFFRVIPVDNDALRDIAYRIRYQVYCEELGFEDSNRFPDGREIDSFDRHSEHCLLLHRQTNRYVGCVRLVLPDPDNSRPLPFEIACGAGLDSSVIELAKRSRGSYAEISRLALCPDYRRRRTMWSSNGNARAMNVHMREEPRDSSQSGASFRRPHVNLRREHRPAVSREFQLMGLGLYLAGAALALNTGLRSVFAMMEPRLARRLRHLGIHFRQVGDVVEYRGLRGPFQITRDGLFSELCPGLRSLLDILVADLQASNPFELAAS